MIIKEQENTTEDELISYFQDCDLILLEGFKYSNYPKIEIIRRGNSEKSVCKKETLLAIATDNDIDYGDIDVININDIDSIVNLIISVVKRS